MNLLDRVRLLVRSTIGGIGSNFPDIAFTPDENGLKLLDKAQARIEMLQADIARAEKRGDEALAARLKREVDDLQHTVNRARKKLGQPVVPAASTPAQPAVGTSASQPSAKTRHETPAVELPQAQTKEQAEDQPMDDSRVADQIRKAREGKP
jgi:uncharacterized membrane protein